MKTVTINDEISTASINDVEYKLEMALPYAAPPNTPCQLCDAQKECCAGDTDYSDVCRLLGAEGYLKRAVPTCAKTLEETK